MSVQLIDGKDLQFSHQKHQKYQKRRKNYFQVNRIKNTSAIWLNINIYELLNDLLLPLKPFIIID
jgi:hypothetical protein